MEIYPSIANETWPLNIEICRRRGHLVYAHGGIEFCYVCHVRTDQSFAAYSKALLVKVIQAA